jgi:hypothetical protein
MARWHWRKRRFTGGTNFFVMAAPVSMTIRLAGYRQLRQKANTSSVCEILYEVTDEGLFRRYQLESFAAFFTEICTWITFVNTFFKIWLKMAKKYIWKHNVATEFEGFWQCCITLKITGFLDFFIVRERRQSSLLGCLERANLNHWTTHVEAEVEVTLRLTINQSVRLGVEPTVELSARY